MGTTAPLAPSAGVVAVDAAGGDVERPTLWRKNDVFPGTSKNESDKPNVIAAMNAEAHLLVVVIDTVIVSCVVCPLAICQDNAPLSKAGAQKMATQGRGSCAKPPRNEILKFSCGDVLSVIDYLQLR